MASSKFELADYSSAFFYLFALLPAATLAAMIFIGISGNTIIYYFTPIPAIVLLMLLYAGYALNHIALKVSTSEVELVGLFYGRKIDKSAIKREEARRVDLREKS